MSPQASDGDLQALAGAPAEDRGELLGHLLKIEAEWRGRLGEGPTATDYLPRFPEAGTRIEEALDATGDEGSRSLGAVGRYELMEELGRGGEGVVYRARDNEGLVPHEVAVKVLPPGAFRSRDAAARFVAEVRSLQGLRHPHIVPFLGSGEDRGQPYYVMELMTSSLARRLHDGPPIAPADAAKVLIPIAEAIEYLHGREMAHFDLKPANILIDANGGLRVADFGLARLLREAETGGVRGTFPYIAPERLDARFGDVGPPCDVYSLGVILYELLAGRAPFPRSRSSIHGTLHVEPVPPSRVRAGVPHDLERICLRCLRKSSSERYTSAADLLEDLRRFDRGEPLATPPDGAWRRLAHWARREPALAARLGVVVACSVILWGFLLVVGHLAPVAMENHWRGALTRIGVIPRLLSVEWALVWVTQAILAAWGLASWAFQRQWNRRGGRDGLQFGWRIVDVAALGLLIDFDNALMSPLTVAFPVLIVASSFWASSRQVWMTTLLSMAGDFLLVLSDRTNHPGLDRPYRHFHYLVALSCLGLILSYQANRMRALMRICGPCGRA